MCMLSLSLSLTQSETLRARRGQLLRHCFPHCSPDVLRLLLSVRTDGRSELVQARTQEIELRCEHGAARE